MNDIIPFTMETQMHAAGPICALLCAIYAMLVREFGPTFCISIFFENGIMKLTLGVYLSPDVDVTRYKLYLLFFTVWLVIINVNMDLLDRCMAYILSGLVIIGSL